MKKILAIIMVMVLILVSSVPGYADDNGKETPSRNTMTYTTGYDGNGNRFRVKGTTIADLTYGYARTYYEVRNYGGGVKSSMYYVTCYYSINTTVSFSDGTTQNTTTLSASSYAASGNTDPTVIEHAQIVRSSSFTGHIYVINCEHEFYNDAGGNAAITFYSVALVTL